jgi:hypothetical protein
MFVSNVLPHKKTETFFRKSRSCAHLVKDLRDLDIIVQEEFIRIRPETEGIHFLGALVVDPHIDRVLGEHIAFEQKAWSASRLSRASSREPGMEGTFTSSSGAILDVLVQRMPPLLWEGAPLAKVETL